MRLDSCKPHWLAIADCAPIAVSSAMSAANQLLSMFSAFLVSPLVCAMPRASMCMLYPPRAAKRAKKRSKKRRGRVSGERKAGGVRAGNESEAWVASGWRTREHSTRAESLLSSGREPRARRLHDMLTASHGRVHKARVEERFAKRPRVVHLRRGAPLGRGQAEVHLPSQIHLPSGAYGGGRGVARLPAALGRVHVLERAVLGLENKLHGKRLIECAAGERARATRQRARPTRAWLRFPKDF